MNKNYDKAFEFIMKWEGYKSDDPDDSGGRTIFGISERFHPETVKRLWDLPKAEAREEAKIFYKVEYWDRYRCGGYADGEDVFFFDCYINMKPSDVGIIRESIFKLGYGLADPFFARMRLYSQKVKEKPIKIKYLRGWLNRVIDLWEYLK